MKSILKTGGLAALLCLVQVAQDARACSEVDALMWGFAKRSPLTALEAPERDAKSEIVNVEFARAYAMIRRDGGHAMFCIEGRSHWFSRADFTVTRDPRRIVATKSMESLTRPRLEFWRSLERLQIYLGRENSAEAGPAFQEVPSGTVPRGAALPLIREEAVFTDVGNRVFDALNILAPIRRDAIEAYERIRSAGGEDDEGPILIALDVSGSTEGFTRKAMTSLQAALLEGPASTRTDDAVIVAGFGGDGHVEYRGAAKVSDEDFVDWTPRPSRDPMDPDHPVGAAVATLSERSARGGVLVVLAGGDVGLAGIDTESFTNVIVAQITPERQTALAETAKAAGASFVDFPDIGEARLADLLNADAPAKRGRSTLEPEAFAELADLAARQGSIGLLPVDIEGSDQLAVAPPGLKEFDWFAIPLWIVFRKALLEIEED